MTDIPPDHPRYESLLAREKVAAGVKMGITSIQGLIAQGRGESFDYLIGERSTEAALYAERAAVAALLLAKNPVISVNGNVAALAPEKVVSLADITGAKIEVNLFHRTDTRVHLIIEHLKASGASEVLGKNPDASLELSHDRRLVDSKGIYIADVVLVPLEDGDRCEKLVKMGKTVITIDLNPLSRTSKTATISIVDNLTRALENMAKLSQEMKKERKEALVELITTYENKKTLSEAISEIQEHLKTLVAEIEY
ncbi:MULTISPECIES: 4-phosphopantoate--beta-alanine ligase [unclassified Methanosarcina]|uniref:4-phosphopantoate--beta-alanine ligase n=1 Tax=unclassified Methanosarcina TaxID=2644672 RepID=UPI0006159429|nr:MULTISPECIES: 4-phosphopantoate--beta-alanine ligase [unclassified Methanosarcina]AKB19697.1 Phosphopantothenate synthetase, archaeal [Methanosarcina sp. WWM596]AKB22510.1 Phosphopantothenate synthetase, archaeal [Methanosarcina sp. WH1]